MKELDREILRLHGALEERGQENVALLAQVRLRFLYKQACFVIAFATPFAYLASLSNHLQ